MIDLHLHSNLSDGTLSPFEIIAAAKKSGVTALSITDHDTMAAYPEVLSLGQENQIEVLPGIEVTAHHQEFSLHVLGFGLSYNSASLAEGLHTIQQARQERNRQVIAKLIGFNLPISMDDLPQGIGQTGRPHIARVLVNKGVVHSEQEAFAKYLRKDGAAYVKRQLLPVRQAIAMIAEAGGLAVFAHPGSLKMGESDLTALVRELVGSGLSGIEVYHPIHSEKMLRFLGKLCHSFGLIATGGSDFHGREGDKAPIGETGGRRRVPAQLLPAIKSRLANYQQCQTI